MNLLEYDDLFDGSDNSSHCSECDNVTEDLKAISNLLHELIDELYTTEADVSCIEIDYLLSEMKQIIGNHIQVNKKMPNYILSINKMERLA